MKCEGKYLEGNAHSRNKITKRGDGGLIARKEEREMKSPR